MIRRSGAEEAETHFAIQRAACLPALAHIFPPELYPFPDDEVLRRWRDFAGTVSWPSATAPRSGSPVWRRAGCTASTSLPEWWGTGVADELHAEALAAMPDCPELKLWVLEENHRARRFYEKRGWRLNGETRVVPYPPSPLDVGYAYVREEP